MLPRRIRAILHARLTELFVGLLVSQSLLFSVGPTARADPRPRAAGASFDFNATVTVDGVQFVDVAKSESLVQGELKNGLCYFGEIDIEFDLPDNVGATAYEVGLDVTKDCQLVVSRAAALASPPADELHGTAFSSSRTPPVDHRGWATFGVWEQFKILTTETRVAMTYTRDGGQVYNGRDLYTLGWIDYYFPWTSTLQALNYATAGPNEVFISARYKYSSPTPPRPSYALSARFTANPGPQQPSCSFSQGSLPPLWTTKCKGGLYY